MPWGNSCPLRACQPGLHGLPRRSAGARAAHRQGRSQSARVAAPFSRGHTGLTAAGNPFQATPCCLAINREGGRYVDESLGYVANGKATLRQPRQTTARIFDEEIRKLPDVATSVGVFQRLRQPIVEAASLDELARCGPWGLRAPPRRFIVPRGASKGSNRGGYLKLRVVRRKRAGQDSRDPWASNPTRNCHDSSPGAGRAGIRADRDLYGHLLRPSGFATSRTSL